MSTRIEHEASLRAALHAAADSLEPRGDGLERIRSRLRQPRPVPIAWSQAVSTQIAMRASAWLHDVAYRMADWYRLASERFAPAQASGRHRSRAHGLLRPLAAMAVVMFIVAAGTYVAIDASTAIFPAGSNSTPNATGGGGHSGAPAPGASHTNGTQSALGTGSHPTAAPSCKPSTKPNGSNPTPAAQPSAGASTSTSPSVDPSDSSTSTDTSDPSPTDTSADSPAASPAATVPPPPPATTSPSPVPVLTKTKASC